MATPDDAQEVCAAIRERVREVHGDAAADGVRILYGGSVKAANVAGIMDEAGRRRRLVGGASLQADEFGGICRFYDMPAALRSAASVDVGLLTVTLALHHRAHDRELL